MSTFREERRRDKAAEAEQKRADAQAAAEAEAARLKAAAEADAVRTSATAEAQRQADKEARAAQRQAERDKQAARDKRREQRKAAVARLAATLSENRVALFIYSIALVSFAMSAPAMASYGDRIYAKSSLPFTGWLLPVVTELSMWACAFAVHHRRRTAPGASVLWLQVGVATSTALAAALNAMKGATVGWDASTVMGVVSIAGVLLHQMAVAGTPRTRSERLNTRIARQAERKATKARRAAIRDAAVDIDTDGRASLVFEPGVYRVGRDRKPSLTRVADNLDRPGPRDAMDDALDALLDTETGLTDQADGDFENGDAPAQGGVATLEPPRPDGPDYSNGPAQTPDHHSTRTGGRQRRPIAQLRTELTELMRQHPDTEWSASAIARALGCGKAKARALRDELNTKGEQ